MADSFSENLRRLRLEKRLTQQQLSKMMFIDRSSVARWENGTRIPDLILVRRLAWCRISYEMTQIHRFSRMFCCFSMRSAVINRPDHAERFFLLAGDLL
jgi:DNA-binding XRE family transcriptional regulator